MTLIGQACKQGASATCERTATNSLYNQALLLRLLLFIFSTPSVAAFFLYNLAVVFKYCQKPILLSCMKINELRTWALSRDLTRTEFNAALMQILRHADELSKNLADDLPENPNINQTLEYVKKTTRGIGRIEGLTEAYNFLSDTFVKKSETP